MEEERIVEAEEARTAGWRRAERDVGARMLEFMVDRFSSRSERVWRLEATMEDVCAYLYKLQSAMRNNDKHAGRGARMTG